MDEDEQPTTTAMAEEKEEDPYAFSVLEQCIISSSQEQILHIAFQPPPSSPIIINAENEEEEDSYASISSSQEELLRSRTRFAFERTPSPVITIDENEQDASSSQRTPAPALADLSIENPRSPTHQIDHVLLVSPTLENPAPHNVREVGEGSSSSCFLGISSSQEELLRSQTRFAFERTPPPPGIAIDDENEQEASSSQQTPVPAPVPALAEFNIENPRSPTHQIDHVLLVSPPTLENPAPHNVREVGEGSSSSCFLGTRTDILEAVQRNGLKVSRPRWWKEEGYPKD